MTDIPSSSKNFHYLEPDYSLPTIEIDANFSERIRSKLEFLYGKESIDEVYEELLRIMRVYYAHKTPEMMRWERDFDKVERFTEKDVILITYGDLISGNNKKPLVTLSKLCNEYLRGVFNTLHLLPFFP